MNLSAEEQMSIIGELCACLIHEIRNSLAAIVYANDYQRKIVNGDFDLAVVKETNQRIAKAAASMNEILKELENFSQKSTVETVEDVHLKDDIVEPAFDTAREILSCEDANLSIVDETHAKLRQIPVYFLHFLLTCIFLQMIRDPSDKTPNNLSVKIEPSKSLIAIAITKERGLQAVNAYSKITQKLCKTILSPLGAKAKSNSRFTDDVTLTFPV